MDTKPRVTYLHVLLKIKPFQLSFLKTKFISALGFKVLKSNLPHGEHRPYSDQILFHIHVLQNCILNTMITVSELRVEKTVFNILKKCSEKSKL